MATFPPCSLPSRRGIEDDHGQFPPLIRIRRARTMATFPLCSLPSRRGMEGDHDHSPPLLRTRRAERSNFLSLVLSPSPHLSLSLSLYLSPSRNRGWGVAMATLLHLSGGESKTMDTFLTSFWECNENDNVHTSFLSQEEKSQRPWLLSFLLLGRGWGGR